MFNRKPDIKKASDKCNLMQVLLSDEPKRIYEDAFHHGMVILKPQCRKHFKLSDEEELQPKHQEALTID